MIDFGSPSILGVHLPALPLLDTRWGDGLVPDAVPDAVSSVAPGHIGGAGARNWRKGNGIKFGRWTEGRSGSVPGNRKRLPPLPRSRKLTQGPVTRIEVRPYWPSDDVRQIAQRCGVRVTDLWRMLETQGFCCALCGASFDPWRKPPRLADGSKELVCVGCRARLRLASGSLLADRGNLR